MACCLLPTDSSSGPLVGDRMWPNCFFSGNGDNCGQLGTWPSGMYGWGTIDFIPCSLCCLLSSAQVRVSCLFFLAFALLQEEEFNRYHRPSATLSLGPATLEVVYVQGSPLVETDQTLAHLSAL